MIVDVVRTAEGLAGLRDEWDALFAVTPEVSGFQSHAWVSACRAHDDEGSALHVSVVRDGERAVAVFPARLDRRGRLAFVGRDVSNYAGPVFDPDRLEPAVAAWAQQLRDERAVRSVDLDGLRERSPFSALVRENGLPGWGPALTVATHVCTEIDLTAGWEALAGRHKSKQRAAWRRKASRLAKLGELEFREIADDDELVAAFPRAAELFAARWEGLNVDGFAAQLPFQADAARGLSADGLALLSTLQLDGDIVAFAYGIRGPGVTTSYVLAHDDRFARFSPGLLLLLRVLEAAADRGDERYDFSVGEAPYKALWMSGHQRVHRALWGPGRRRRALWSTAWSRARDNERLRSLKLEGPRSLLPHRDPPAAPAPDVFVHRLPGGDDDRVALRPVGWGALREALDGEDLALAVERGFRGDEPLAIDEDGGRAGLVWRAAKERRKAIAGASDGDVYYDPVGGDRAVAALARGATGLLVTRAALPALGGGERFTSEAEAWAVPRER